MPINFDLKRFVTDIFIETGTYQGEGVKKALSAGFQTIYSIEIDKKRYEQCVDCFKWERKVNLFHGDSTVILPYLLKKITKRCTFWLDAHYSNDHTTIGEKWTPLVEELEAIKQHPIKNHIILVDDFRRMDEVGYDEETKKEKGFPGKKALLDKLQSINPAYKVEVIGDIVVAMV